MPMAWRAALGASWIIAVGLVLGPAACSEGGARPPVGEPGGGRSERVDAAPPTGFPAACSNTVKDRQETDVDCGGGECAKCIDGKSCTSKNDCAGDACLNQKCVTPACNDGQRSDSSGETDIDCGGAICTKCTLGKGCKGDGDCVTGSCGNGQCKCPAGMVEVSRAGGAGAYCIDQVEVTKGQYNRFITANVPIADQIDACKPPTNEFFIPRAAWPPAETPGGLAFNYSLPVHYVDWCDAFAYCRWAGKELCGKVTGGAADYTKPTDATADAWFNACSAQGNIAFPYGNDFFSDRCNGGQAIADAGAPGTGGYGYPENKDEGVRIVVTSDTNGNYNGYTYTACAGGVTNLYQMSGNLAEWENSCENTTAGARCRVRGGSYKAGVDNAAGLRCDVARTELRVPPTSAGADPLEDIGFRCCLY
jgi:formylglycine-generating enzyme required for sulfatase activity